MKLKIRGMEAAQSALLLVLGTVVAVGMYLLVTNMMSATPTPDIQIDPYRSYIAGRYAVVSLKFGKPTRVHWMHMVNQYGDWIGDCWPEGHGYPVEIRAGDRMNFYCWLAHDKVFTPRVIIRVWVDQERTPIGLTWVIG